MQNLSRPLTQHYIGIFFSAIANKTATPNRIYRTPPRNMQNRFGARQTRTNAVQGPGKKIFQYSNLIIRYNRISSKFMSLHPIELEPYAGELNSR